MKVSPLGAETVANSGYESTEKRRALLPPFCLMGGLIHRQT